MYHDAKHIHMHRMKTLLIYSRKLVLYFFSSISNYKSIQRMHNYMYMVMIIYLKDFITLFIYCYQ